MGDISSGNIKSVGVCFVDCEVEGVENEVALRAELPATSELKAQSEAVLQIPFVTAVLLHRNCALLFCIEIKVFKTIPVQRVQAGSPKANCHNFSCMRYCTLILQLPTPYFFSVVVLRWCHECFV